jgi:hypothetical protein
MRQKSLHDMESAARRKEIEERERLNAQMRFASAVTGQFSQRLVGVANMAFMGHAAFGIGGALVGGGVAGAAAAFGLSRQMSENAAVAFPGLGLQRLMARRDLGAVIGRGGAQAYMAETEMYRAAADLIGSPGGQRGLRMALGPYEDVMKGVAAFWRLLTPRDAVGRSVGAAPLPTLGQHGLPEDWNRRASEIALQTTSPQAMEQTKLLRDIRDGKGGPGDGRMAP